MAFNFTGSDMTKRTNPRATHRGDDDTQQDEAVRSLPQAVVTMLKTSRWLQIGLMAILIAVAMAIVKGYSVSFYGLVVNATASSERPKPQKTVHEADTVLYSLDTVLTR